MALRAVFEKLDGSIIVVIPVPGKALEVAVARTVAATPGAGAWTRRPDIDEADLPARRFRDCWRFSAGQVRVQPALARAKHTKDMKDEFSKRAAESDGLRLKYDDIGTVQQKADVTAYRQALRAIPATVQTDLAALTTEAQFLAYQPPWPALPAGVVP